MPARSLTRIVTRPLTVWTLCLGILAAAYTVKLSSRPVKTEQKMEQRVAEGKSIPVKYYTEIYWWFGAWPSLAICLILLAAGKWITRPLTDNFDPDLGRAPPGTAKWILVAALATVALGAWLNSPRLSLTLWDDEEYIMRRFVVGSYERDVDSGKMIFDQPTWLDTMFDVRRVGNHVLYSTAARLTHSFHHQGTGPHDPYFSEYLVRLPAFVAGLAALGSIAWCLYTFGFYRAALLAPFLLLSHSWFTRMGVDARGYSFVFFAVPAALAALALAVRTGRWRWWFALILFQFILFFGFTGTLYFLVPLNITALLLIWKRPVSLPADRFTLLYRYAAVSGLFALAGIFCFLPCVPMINAYVSGGRFDGTMPLDWWQNLGAYLVSGAPWFPDLPNSPYSYELSALVRDHGLLAWSAIAAITAATLAGAVHLARSPKWPWLVALLATIPLLYAHNSYEGHHVIHWYAVPALPCLLALAAIGASSLFHRLKPPASHLAFTAAAVLLVASIGGLASRYNHLLRTIPFVPLRESVEATGKAVTNPFHPDFDKDIITVGFHQPSVAYDPGVWVFSDPQSSGKRFYDILARADAENRPLYVNLALYDHAKEFYPEIMALVDNPDFFEPVKVFFGLYGASGRHVLRYRPGSVAHAPPLPET